LALAAQRGYQGAFTLFRDLFLKVIHDVDPSATGLNDPGSWTVRKEKDGSTSVVTLGQKIIPEITTAYKSKSKVSMPDGRTLNGSEGYVPFETQPGGRYYAILSTLEWSANATSKSAAGFRVLASDAEWTDIYYDPANEALIVERTNSSLIPSCECANPRHFYQQIDDSQQTVLRQKLANCDFGLSQTAIRLPYRLSISRLLWTIQLSKYTPTTSLSLRPEFIHGLVHQRGPDSLSARRQRGTPMAASNIAALNFGTAC